MSSLLRCILFVTAVPFPFSQWRVSCQTPSIYSPTFSVALTKYQRAKSIGDLVRWRFVLVGESTTNDLRSGALVRKRRNSHRHFIPKMTPTRSVWQVLILLFLRSAWSLEIFSWTERRWGGCVKKNISLVLTGWSGSFRWCFIYHRAVSAQVPTSGCRLPLQILVIENIWPQFGIQTQYFCLFSFYVPTSYLAWSCWICRRRLPAPSPQSGRPPCAPRYRTASRRGRWRPGWRGSSLWWFAFACCAPRPIQRPGCPGERSSWWGRSPRSSQPLPTSVQTWWKYKHTQSKGWLLRSSFTHNWWKVVSRAESQEPGSEFALTKFPDKGNVKLCNWARKHQTKTQEACHTKHCALFVPWGSVLCRPWSQRNQEANATCLGDVHTTQKNFVCFPWLSFAKETNMMQVLSLVGCTSRTEKQLDALVWWAVFDNLRFLLKTREILEIQRPSEGTWRAHRGVKTTASAG